MQSVLSRIWTRVAVSISYDDNDYTTSWRYPSETKTQLHNQVETARGIDLCVNLH